MKNIEILATKFRVAIENAKNCNRFANNQCLNYFPYGCCGIATELLAKFLIENGVKEEIECIYGTYYDFSLGFPTHSWLQIGNNIIVDITGDQFIHYKVPLKFNSAVYVGPNNSFHDSFEINSKELYNHFNPANVISDLEYARKKTYYEIILEYIQ